MIKRLTFFLRVPVLLLLGTVYVVARLFTGLPTIELRTAFVIGMALVYFIMIAGFMFRHDISTPKTDRIAWVSFTFLGFFSWLFVLTVLRDALLLLIFFSPENWYFSMQQYSVWGVLGLSVIATLLGVFNARRTPAIVKVNIPLAAQHSALNGFTIAQISDLHVGPTIKKDFVKKVVAATNALQADVIVLTGDLIDGDVAGLQEHTNELAALSAPHGVFAVTGNHEYYSGADQWIAEYRRLGMRVLQNEHALIQHGEATLVMAGVTDFGAGKFDSAQSSDPQLALANSPADATFKLLLAHQPRSMFAAEPAGFDLQLSGHTHGGQFWPWGYFVPLQQPLIAGLHTYGKLQVYVSQGTGYWGPPLRLGAKSEISLIRLHS